MGASFITAGICLEIERPHLAGGDAGWYLLAAAEVALDHGLAGRVAVHSPIGTGHNAHKTTDAKFRVVTNGSVLVFGQGTGDAGSDAFRFIAMLAQYDEGLAQVPPETYVLEADRTWGPVQ
jgi:hypothetical protein